jgi:hypothetical protein
VWTEEQWAKRQQELAAQRERKERKSPYFGARRAVTGSGDKFSLDDLPSPGPRTQPDPGPAGVSGEAIVPEVVEPGVGPEAPPPIEEGIRHGCPACIKGDAPHRDEKGHFRKGHGTGFGNRGRQNVEIAAEELQLSSPKAVRTLVKALDDKLPWVALTAARTIVERTVPVASAANQAQTAMLIFPPGTKMAVVATPEPAPELEQDPELQS